MAYVAVLHHNKRFDSIMGVAIDERRAIKSYKNKNVMPLVAKAYRNEHGILVATSPCSWDEVKVKVKAGDLTFGRTPEQARVYKETLDKLKQEWDSIDSYCRHRFLGYDYVTNTRVTPGESPRNVKSVKDNARPDREIALVKNDFPYNLEPEVEHFLLWSDEPKSNTVLAGIIEGTFPTDQYEIFWFENIDKNKSVKSVFHIHLFVRTRLNELRPTL